MYFITLNKDDIKRMRGAPYANLGIALASTEDDEIPC